jgi:hypothetical protein
LRRARSTHGEKKNAYRFLVRKQEGKRTLGKPRSRHENIVKIDLRII